MGWHIRPSEDVLLWTHWQSEEVRGQLWREVVLPKGGLKGGTRTVDALIVPGGQPVDRGRRPRWGELAVVQRLDVIEVKPTLDESVIGQLAVARLMISEATDLPANRIHAIALVETASDSELQAVCEELDIEVRPVIPGKALTICFRPEDPCLAQLAALMEREALGSREEALRYAATRYLGAGGPL